jgi:RNA polymerase sigma-70 factor (ECF subfamily)
LAYVLRRTSPAVADDVVAEVFLVAWRRRDDMPGAALPWLLGVARKVLANRRRSEQRALALRHRLASEHESVAAATGDDGDELVIRALGRLPDRDREILMLLAWDGLSQTEVAEVLGVRKNTVAVRLHRARERFVDALAAEDANTPQTTEVPR